MQIFINKKISKCDFRFIIYILLYRIAMDMLYINWISPYYVYWDMMCETNAVRFILALIFFVLVLPFILNHCRMKKSSDVVMVILDFMYFIPGTTYITYCPCENEYLVLYCAFYFVLCLSNELSKVCSLPNIYSPKWLAVVFVSMLLFVTLFYVYRYNGLQIKMDFADIYQNRANYSIASQSYSIIFRYLKSPMAKVIPLLFIVFAKKRRYVVCLGLVCIQLALFSMGANKIDMFLLIIAVGFSLVNVTNKKIVVGFILLSALSIVLCFILDNPMSGITDMMIRRMMFTPNHICKNYYTYFTNNDYLWFSTTVFKKIMPNEYSKDISYIIGDYMGLPGNNANNGLFGAAFADCGLLSVLIFPVIYAVIFCLLNNASKDNINNITIYASFVIAIILIDTNVFTSIFTHGVALLLVVLSILKSVSKNVQTKK